MIKLVRTLSLHQAVDEALRANLDLRVADSAVTAGEYRIKENRSPLLPQIDIGANYLMIDDDTAQASGGLVPERTANATAGLSQIIYSEQAWTNFSVERYRQTSREQVREELRHTILLATSLGYLNVLQARAGGNLSLGECDCQRSASSAEVRVSDSRCSKCPKSAFEPFLAGKDTPGRRRRCRSSQSGG